MYISWFGFREKPFNLTPDPKYIYLSQRHAEAFAHLEFGHKERGGFVYVLTLVVPAGRLANYGLDFDHTVSNITFLDEQGEDLEDDEGADR